MKAISKTIWRAVWVSYKEFRPLGISHEIQDWNVFLSTRKTKSRHDPKSVTTTNSDDNSDHTVGNMTTLFTPVQSFVFFVFCRVLLWSRINQFYQYSSRQKLRLNITCYSLVFHCSVKTSYGKYERYGRDKSITQGENINAWLAMYDVEQEFVVTVKPLI